MLRFPASYAHKTFAFNSHLTAAGAVNEANVGSTVVIDARDILTAYRDLREPLHLAQGGTLGRVHKGMALIRLSGRIEGPETSLQAATISDREREMRAAFDPALCLLDSPSTDGAYAFDFSEYTADTTTYPDGYIPLRYYCRPAETPQMLERIGEKPARAWSLALVAPDPRAYLQTLGSLTLSSGTLSGSVVNKGTVPGPVRVTITMAGAGSSSFTISNGVKTLACSLSGTSNGNVVIIYMETCGPFGRGRRVTLNGTDAFSRKTSAADTWLTAAPGTQTFTITNATNVTTCLVEWGHAWA